MRTPRLLWRVAKILWNSGLLKMSPLTALAVVRAWWHCGTSFAFLGEVAALRFPHKLALQDEQGKLTYSQLRSQSNNWALWLSQRHGVGQGSQVAVVCRNHRGFVLSMLAATRLGADVLPLGSDLPAPVMGKLLRRQQISLVLHDCGLEALLKEGAPEVPRQAVELPEITVGGQLKKVRKAGTLITLTSGTTGISKGIRRRPTLHQVMPVLAGLLENIPFQIHRPFILAIPLHHGYGVATLAISLGLGAPLHLALRYEIAPLLARVEGSELAILLSVPTLLLRWLKVGAECPPLAAIITGSAPLSGELSNRLMARAGPVLFNLYGSSEAGLMSLATPGDLRDGPGTVGHPLPGNAMRILGPSGEQLPRGETGRILAKGPLVLATQEDGWRDTGDLGRIDAAGRLFVCGRADSMLVSGGENVYPHEVEAALLTHPEVVEVAILVVPDEEFSHRMLAAVVRGAESELDSDTLKQWLRVRLERFKVPRSIQMVGAIPRNAVGKVDRQALTRLIAP